jgi:hypothetical protein
MKPMQSFRLASASTALLLLSTASVAQGPCPEEPALANWTGAGTTTCPCFVAGEEAGSIFNIPAAHLPAEILRIGVGWGSQFGGAPQVVEEAIHVYAAGLPNPGSPIFSAPAPLLSDGFINEYDIEPFTGEVIISSNPFTVTLEFFNSNAGQIFSPSVVHDGNGCQPGKNVVYAIPGGWSNSCSLGVSGDWIFHVVYRPLNCGGANQTYCISSTNSTGNSAQIGFVGSTSIGANDLILTCMGGPPGKPGLFIYGPSQQQIPLGEGFLCIAGPIQRIQPPVIIDVFGNALRVVDYGLPPFNSGASAITAGSDWNFQFWYRDPTGGSAGFNLSNGLALSFVP